ncbi:hypothetical protein D3C78_869520 [compost metagenome]
MADTGTAVEADIAWAVQIDPYTLGAGALKDAFADPFAQVVAIAQVDRWSVRWTLFKHQAVAVDGTAGRQGRYEIEHLLASAFAQAQALEQRFDVVAGQGLVIKYVIDLRCVVQQRAIVVVEIVVVGSTQA